MAMTDAEKLKKLGAEWTALDNEYDSKFQELIDRAEPLDGERIAELKKMQDRLFDLETEIYEILKEAR